MVPFTKKPEVVKETVNPLLAESYEERKARLYKLHKSNLDRLMKERMADFASFKVMEKDGRLTVIYKGLTKVYSLFNDELICYVTNDLTNLLNTELKKPLPTN